MDAVDVDEGYVFEIDGVTVEPFRVNHYSSFSDEPSLGYRVKFGGRSVVLSGDTCFCENLIRYSEGADLLIHEVAAAPLGADLSSVRYFMSLHTLPEECCRIFSATKPKLAVYTHVLQYQGVSLEEIMERTRQGYNGRVVFGEDLMRIDVEDSVMVVASKT